MKRQDYKLDFFSAIVLVFGFFAGLIIAWLLMLVLEISISINVKQSGGLQMLMYAVSMVCPVLMFDYLVVRKLGYKLNFNFSSAPFHVYLLIFPMMMGMILISDYFTQLIPTTGDFIDPIYQNFQEQMSVMSSDHVAMVMMTVIMAPILEEILFRGVLMKGMINNRVKPIYAILISSFIFGAAHGYPWQFVGAFLLGLVLGLVYYKTKSLLLPILLHAFNNLLSVLFFLFTDKQSFAELLQWRSEYVLLLGLVVFAVSFYFFAIRKNSVYND